MLRLVPFQGRLAGLAVTLSPDDWHPKKTLPNTTCSEICDSRSASDSGRARPNCNQVVEVVENASADTYVLWRWLCVSWALGTDIEHDVQQAIFSRIQPRNSSPTTIMLYSTINSGIEWPSANQPVLLWQCQSRYSHDQVHLTAHRALLTFRSGKQRLVTMRRITSLMINEI